MAYTNFTNCTKQEYDDIIYSENDNNRIRIWFNNVELLDADEYCESLSGTNRILPDDGSKRFSLENFVSKEYNLILRDLPAGTVIADQVKISIGTLIDEDNSIYEDVPIGIFNIQDTPINDNGRVTIKLRDNRVKFDFYYNAQPLIDSQYILTTDETYQKSENYYSYINNIYTLLVEGTDYEVGDEIIGNIYQKKGTATLGQILTDICTQANVINNVGAFEGSNLEVAIYDNTIYASTYVSWILGQAGLIPTINRLGQLDKIDLTNLVTQKIPLDIVEKYELGTPFEIERVVYESGIIKYESSNDESLSTLYLDAANPYIIGQEQVDYIYNKLNGFQLDSIKTGYILGNPAIDSYDLIQVYGYYEEDESGNAVFVADENTIVFTTLANNTYTYKGNHRNTFDTQIGKEQRTENVSVDSQNSLKKWAKTNINNLEGEITLTAGGINDLEGRVDKAELNIYKQGAKLDIVSTNIDAETGNVLALKTTSYELSEEGFKIDDGSGYRSVSNTTGNYYYDNDTMLGKYTKDGSVQKDMALFGRYYYGIDGDVNVATFSKEKAMFVGQLYRNTDLNPPEEGFGHFYNGN